MKDEMLLEVLKGIVTASAEKPVYRYPTYWLTMVKKAIKDSLPMIAPEDVHCSLAGAELTIRIVNDTLTVSDVGKKYKISIVPMEDN
jgi:hypothetical protein